MLDERPRPLLRRLTRRLRPFRACLGRDAQRISLGHYINGLLGDSARKSMQAMLARVTAPVRYQAFQHFVPDAPWEAEEMWRIMRRQLPERTGSLVFDDTGFPKKGNHSVGVARQYTGTLGQVGNCQVAVTAALWTGGRAWWIRAAPYLPEAWAADPARRRKARIPPTVVFQKKWDLALRLLDDAVAANLHVTGVLADAGYGDVAAFRAARHERGLPYAVGVAATTSVFVGTPVLLSAPGGATPAAMPHRRPTRAPGHASVAVRDLAAAWAPSAWRDVSWRNGTNAPRAARFAACRVTPAHPWQERLEPEVWLLCERRRDGSYDDKCFLIHRPVRTSLARLVSLAHARWPIEPQYQPLKTELGLDHFDGVSVVERGDQGPVEEIRKEDGLLCYLVVAQAGACVVEKPCGNSFLPHGGSVVSAKTNPFANSPG